jgi:hypothetical protein
MPFDRQAKFTVLSGSIRRLSRRLGDHAQTLLHENVNRQAGMKPSLPRKRVKALWRGTHSQAWARPTGTSAQTLHPARRKSPRGRQGGLGGFPKAVWFEKGAPMSEGSANCAKLPNRVIASNQAGRLPGIRELAVTNCLSERKLKPWSVA